MAGPRFQTDAKTFSRVFSLSLSLGRSFLFSRQPSINLLHLAALFRDFAIRAYTQQRPTREFAECRPRLDQSTIRGGPKCDALRTFAKRRGKNFPFGAKVMVAENSAGNRVDDDALESVDVHRGGAAVYVSVLCRRRRRPYLYRLDL